MQPCMFQFSQNGRLSPHWQGLCAPYTEPATVEYTPGQWRSCEPFCQTTML